MSLQDFLIEVSTNAQSLLAFEASPEAYLIEKGLAPAEQAQVLNGLAVNHTTSIQVLHNVYP